MCALLCCALLCFALLCFALLCFALFCFASLSKHADTNTGKGKRSSERATNPCHPVQPHPTPPPCTPPHTHPSPSHTHLRFGVMSVCSATRGARTKLCHDIVATKAIESMPCKSARRRTALCRLISQPHHGIQLGIHNFGLDLLLQLHHVILAVLGDDHALSCEVLAATQEVALGHDTLVQL